MKNTCNREPSPVTLFRTMYNQNYTLEEAIEELDNETVDYGSANNETVMEFSDIAEIGGDGTMKIDEILGG